MTGEPSRTSEDPSEASLGEEDRVALVASRLRQGAAGAIETERVSSFALSDSVAGDFGHLHAAYDLTALPIPARERATKPIVVRMRRLLRQGMYPLFDAQTQWNGANARVISFLLRQLVAQARAIESLEDQVARLHEELKR